MVSTYLHRMPGRCDGSYGQGKAEGGAVADAAFDRDLSSEGFDEAAHERQTQAGAGFIGRAEAAKDSGEALGLDAAAGVADEELDFVAALFGFEPNGAVVGCVAQALLSRLSRMLRTARRSALTYERSAKQRISISILWALAWSRTRS